MSKEIEEKFDIKKLADVAKANETLPRLKRQREGLLEERNGLFDSKFPQSKNSDEITPSKLFEKEVEQVSKVLIQDIIEKRMEKKFVEENLTKKMLQDLLPSGKKSTELEKKVAVSAVNNHFDIWKNAYKVFLEKAPKNFENYELQSELSKNTNTARILREQQYELFE